MSTTTNRERVAVVGSGVSGLTAAYLLQRRFDVTLFESDARLGGHAHTHDVLTSRGTTTPIDSGFIVHNQKTYPNLLRLFGELSVATQDSDMSMSVSCAGCGLEYAGAKGLTGLFAQPRNVTRPRYLQMLAEVTRFHRHARRVLAGELDDVTVAAFVAIGGYTEYFVQHFLVPVISSVWSAGSATSLQYPARYLFEFLANHGMLSVGGSPQWKTVVGGSRSYVQRAVKELAAVEVSTPVRAVSRVGRGIEIRDDADVVHEFDRVVIATHADTALSLRVDPSEQERQVLGSFSYSRNSTALHTDDTLLPSAHRAWSSWNYRKPSCAADRGSVVVSYHMNRLMSLSEPENYVVTLNADDVVDQTKIVARMSYEHPIYTPRSVAAQRQLPTISDERLAYAGAYHGWGFHEDGCAAGVRAAASLGVDW